MKMNFLMLDHLQPSNRVLLHTEYKVKHALLCPSAGVPVLIDSITNLLKCVGPKPHPSLRVDLLPLHDPSGCLPVLIEHIIILLKLIEPKPDPSVLTRVTQRMRECSIILKVPAQSHVRDMDGIPRGGGGYMHTGFAGPE